MSTGASSYQIYSESLSRRGLVAKSDTTKAKATLNRRSPAVIRYKFDSTPHPHPLGERPKMLAKLHAKK
jgi:hypothetical protein